MRISRATGGPGRALLVALHGAGSGGAPGGLWAFRGAWNVPDLVIVAPAAAGTRAGPPVRRTCVSSTG